MPTRDKDKFARFRCDVWCDSSTTSARSASAAARGFGGQVAFSSLDKSNIPDILAKV